LHLPIVLLLLLIADLFAGYLGDFIALIAYVAISILRVASVPASLAVPPGRAISFSVNSSGVKLRAGFGFSC